MTNNTDRNHRELGSIFDKQNGTPLVISPPRQRKLTVCRKLCYGLGGIPIPLTHTIIAFYISLFLLEVAELSPFYTSVVVFSGRAWDAVTDPLIGYYMTKIDSRFGKIKPWLFLSTPFGACCYFLLWSIPESDTMEFKFLYYLVCYCAFQTFHTCYSVPHAALTMYITHDQHERDSATAYRILLDVAGVVVGMIIQAAILTSKMGSISRDPCKNVVIDRVFEEKQNNYTSAFGTAALAISVIYCLCAVVVTFGVKEYKDEAVSTQDENDSFVDSLKTVFSHEPYVKLLLTFVSFALTMQIIQGNLILYAKHALHIDEYQSAIILLLISALVSVPLWQIFLNKYGKVKALYTGMVLFLPLVMSLLVVPGYQFVIYILAMLSGVCVSAASLLPWSMIPDVIDDFTVKTGTRKETIFYSFYVFFNKFASGVALGVSTMVLGFAGYKTGECEQPQSVGLALRIFASVVPSCLILFGFKFLAQYPIDGDRRLANKRALAEMREQRQLFTAAERYLNTTSKA